MSDEMDNILELMQETFVDAYKKEYFKNPQASHTVAINAVFEAIRPYLHTTDLGASKIEYYKRGFNDAENLYNRTEQGEV